MSDGYTIGFKELYDSITTLSAQVNTAISDHSQQIANNLARIEMLERQVQAQWKLLQDHRGNTWQTNLAIASGVCGLLAAFVVPLATK